MERVHSNEMELPQVVICAQLGYKKDVFTNMGVTEDIFRDHLDLDSAKDLDFESLWENGTYSRDELNVFWIYQLGKTGIFVKLTKMLCYYVDLTCQK